MGILVKIIIFLTAISTSVFSAPSVLISEKVIPNGNNIVDVTPILDLQNELAGYIYTDSVLNKIIIDKFESDSSIIIDIPSTPCQTIVHQSETSDTLFIYTVSLKTWERPKLSLIFLSENTIKQNTIDLPTNISPGLGSFYSSDKIKHLKLKFYPNNYNPTSIIFEFCFTADEYETTQGPTANNVSTSLIYPLDLSEILYKSPQTNVFPSNLFSEESKNYITSELYYSYYDFSEPDFPDAYGKILNQSLSIYDNFGIQNSEIQTAYNNIYSIHVDNFAPSSATDELIYHANSQDLLSYYESEDHIACYKFDNGYPEELWYNSQVEGIDFSYIYKAKDLLVGINRQNTVYMLNYLNGAISDSSDLNAFLTKTHFFETQLNQPILNLVGMSKDTLKSYQFDISTNIYSSSIEEEIPQTFNLHQNHPNPFNGETRLEFSNTESQNLKLSIFNILGQEIKILVAAKFSPGTYSYYWDGKNDDGLVQSTGIYFARLESEISSQMIKLIYLK